jgi:hypothetical protein
VGGAPIRQIHTEPGGLMRASNPEACDFRLRESWDRLKDGALVDAVLTTFLHHATP